MKRKIKTTIRRTKFIIGGAMLALVSMIGERMISSKEDGYSLLDPLLPGPTKEAFAVEGDDGSSGGCGCGNGDGDGRSTPFLYTWNGERFRLENDILFGKPCSFFQSIEAGREAYERGDIQGDLYRIQNDICAKNGKLIFKIKEVEPEESFFDHFSLLRVQYPKNAELVVDSSYKRFWIFEKDAIKNKEGIKKQIVFDKNHNDISHKITTQTVVTRHNVNSAKTHVMEMGDIIEIKGIVNDGIRPLFLFLGSQCRDWTAGRIAQFDKASDAHKNISLFSKRASILSPRGVLQLMTLVLLASVVWVSGFADRINRTSSERNTANDVRTLVDAFGIPTARAGSPVDHNPPPDPVDNDRNKSLVIEYWNGKIFQKIDVVQPRYYQSTTEAVVIPAEAIQNNKEVNLRITATKRHKVTSAFLVAPKKQLSYKSTVLKPRKVFHQRTERDYSDVINQKNSKEYLHTISADIVDVEFDVPQVNTKEKVADNNEAYLVQAGGYYAPASEETQRVAGDWVAKLDPEAREWLKEMYSLADYHKSDRTTVL